MGGLPHPNLEPGPHRELVDALHDLHHRSGWPSLRVLAREAGCSPTTVSAVFSSPRLPSWGVLELLVEAMDGDVGEFHRRWLAASTPTGTPTGAESTAPLIAGRKPELATVRRHVREGAGLLMVTGEAGMGKTRLVTTAASLSAATTFVAVGSCLPLAIDVPLLPVADLLRSTYARDGGRWLTEALADCAPYVAASVQRLVPELEPVVGAPPAPEDEWSRQRLFGAVGTTLEALASRHRLAVLLEDLHWADWATLDLVEHLIARGVAVPVLGTWRLDDPATPEHTSRWWMRVQRLPTVTSLALHPLSRDETAEQVELLVAGRADPGLVDRIHRRSEGQPLFTEQLAAQADGQSMPRFLADLLDRRLDGLGREAWRVARALGVADRALDDGLLTDITGLDTGDLATGLHELGNRHLMRPSTGNLVELGHPLQAEAVRRRLVAPEAVAEHRRIADAMGRSSDPSAAEVAEHWQRADDPAEEIVWRIRAARSAMERFALAQAGTQWRRVLDLWPATDETAGSPPVRRSEVFVAAMDALVKVDLVTARDVAEEGMRHLADGTDADAAETLQRAADITGRMGDPEGGLVLADRAIALHEPTAPSVGYVRALHQRRALLDNLGRYGDSRAASARTLAACADIDEPRLLRNLLIEEAYHEAFGGDLDRGLASLDAAAAVELAEPDPDGDIHQALTHTHLLMTAGRDSEQVVEAGRPGLEAAAAWGLETSSLSLLRANVSVALRVAGRVGHAAALIDPLVHGEHPSHEDGPVQAERATLDMLRGRCTEALARLDALAALPPLMLANLIENAEDAATVALWCGRPHSALDRLVAALQESMATEVSVESSGVLALAARAAADVADASALGAAGRRELLATLQELRGRAARDPFEPSRFFAARPAHAAAWAAESARLAGRQSVERWVDAARHWDRLGRPHDAAYCRWRGAQVALTGGRGTIAQRLLRRAATEAREHLPLSSAIAATAEQASRAARRAGTPTAARPPG